MRDYFRGFHFVILLTGLIFATPFSVQCATLVSDGSDTDIQDLIDNSAANGDTITLPSGTFTWTAGVVIDLAITLEGAGMGITTVKDGCASGYLLDVSLVANLTTRVTQIGFTNGGGGRVDNRMRFSGTDIDNRRIRIDHCLFNQLTGPATVFFTCLGVFDHNVVFGAASGVPVFLGHVINSAWGYAQGTSAWGDGAFVALDQFGTEKFLFFESNVFSNLYAPSALTMLDGHSGARYVFRSNHVSRGQMEIHGAEAARTRGGRAYEIYNNTFASDDTRSSPLYMRGGVGLVYSNVCTGWNGASTVFSLLDNRLIDHLFAPIGGADGISPWDVNHAANPQETSTATSAGALTVTASAESWTNDFWAGFTVRKTSGKSVTSLTRVGTTATVACTGHGFDTGNLISIWGANQQPFNFLYSITKINDDSFTFVINFPPAETTATGTIKCALGNSFGLIISNTGTQLTFADSIYGASARLNFTGGDTFEINKVTQTMDQNGVIGGTDLAGVDVPSAWSNTQTVSAWYEWNNTREGDADIDFSTGFSAGGNFPTIVENIHYFNDTAKPGYSAFRYPHDLVSGFISTPRTFSRAPQRGRRF